MQMNMCLEHISSLGNSPMSAICQGESEKISPIKGCLRWHNSIECRWQTHISHAITEIFPSAPASLLPPKHSWLNPSSSFHQLKSPLSGLQRRNSWSPSCLYTDLIIAMSTELQCQIWRKKRKETYDFQVYLWHCWKLPKRYKWW